MTVTTSRRFDLFERTMRSLRKFTDAARLISQCVIIDDRSTVAEQMQMVWLVEKLFSVPVRILFNEQETGYRHCASMEIWREISATQGMVFAMEDDWEFFDSDCPIPIEWGMKTLEANDWIGQAVLIDQLRTSPLDKPVPFWITTFENSPRHTTSRFTLNPSVIRMSSIARTGEFVSGPEAFEVQYGNRWVAKGYLPVYHPTGFCSHIGDVSAYDINKSLR
jgi:hypothetical protein